MDAFAWPRIGRRPTGATPRPQARNTPAAHKHFPHSAAARDGNQSHDKHRPGGGPTEGGKGGRTKKQKTHRPPPRQRSGLLKFVAHRATPHSPVPGRASTQPKAGTIERGGGEGAAPQLNVRGGVVWYKFGRVHKTNVLGTLAVPRKARCPKRLVLCHPVHHLSIKPCEPSRL